jgi:hypothetical protein
MTLAQFEADVLTRLKTPRRCSERRAGFAYFENAGPASSSPRSFR